MKTFYNLENSVQTYAWGSPNGISDFTGIPNTDSQPMAELWMGAHPSFPSCIIPDNSTDKIPLDKFISENPENTLGKKTIEYFDKKLPFLFKILSAAAPLSLQVHPSKEQAEKGFARENNENISLSSPERKYKDDNHKPEIIMALTPFTAMCGFRKPEETIRLIFLLQNNLLDPSLLNLQSSGNYTEFYKNLLELQKSGIIVIMQNIISRVKQIIKTSTDSETTTAFSLLLDLSEYYPNDIGILAPLFLNIIMLNPFEAVYLPSGIMHAYIRGTGLELMASSDNVLRGGLTPKYIDKTELLSILNSSSFKPEIIVPVNQNGLFRYKTDSTEFELSSVVLHDNTITFQTLYPSIFLGATGQITVVSSNGDQYILTRGKTAFVCATCETLVFSGNGNCYIASIPDNKQIP